MKAGTYHLHGGPADGEHVEIDDQQARDAEVGGGVVYVDDDEVILGRYALGPVAGRLDWKPA